MLGSSSVCETSPNGLNRLSAVMGIALGFFFLLGAFGHTHAVISLVDVGLSKNHRFLLLLPGLILAFTGLVNLCLCLGLWFGKPRVRLLVLVTSVLTAVYLAYLLHRGVPDHPIGSFLALVSSQVVVLSTIQIGLVWPSVSACNQPK